MTEQDFHIIESYTMGTMTPQEKEAFEQRLKVDPELKVLVDQVKSSILAVRQSALDDKWSLLKEVEIHEMKTGAKIRPLKLVMRWAALAAIIIACAIIFRPVFFPDNTIKNKYLAEHFDEYVLHSTVRGDNSEIKVTKEQERAYNLYQIREFHKAMPLLEDLWEVERDTLALFYLITSNIAIKKEVKKYDYKLIFNNSYRYSSLISKTSNNN